MKWLLFIAIVLVVATLAPILLNRPPLSTPPGPWARLKTYLSANEARVSPATEWANLRSPVMVGSLGQVKSRVLSAMHRLGWRHARETDGVLKAEVVTPWLKFRDDIEVRLEPVSGGVRLLASSRSRVGKADFAANERHLSELLAMLR